MNEFGFSAEMLSEQQAKPAVESPVATVNGHPISVREVETTKSAASTDAAPSEPAAADSEDGVKTGAWKSQKQKSKKAKKID